MYIVQIRHGLQFLQPKKAITVVGYNCYIYLLTLHLKINIVVWNRMSAAAVCLFIHRVSSTIIPYMVWYIWYIEQRAIEIEIEIEKKQEKKKTR